MSLVYGCVYILRFRTMKDMYKAAKWAEVRKHSMRPCICDSHPCSGSTAGLIDLLERLGASRHAFRMDRVVLDLLLHLHNRLPLGTAFHFSVAR